MLKIIEENISFGTTKLMRIIWKNPIAFFFHTTIRFTDKKCKLESHTVIKSLC